MNTLLDWILVVYVYPWIIGALIWAVRNDWTIWDHLPYYREAFASERS